MSETGFPCPRCGPSSRCEGYYHSKLEAGLVQGAGAYVSTDPRRLSEYERRLVGLEEPRQNGHRKPQPQPARSLEDLFAAFEDEAEHDWRRWAGLIAGESSK